MILMSLLALLASPDPRVSPPRAPAPIVGGQPVAPGGWPETVAVITDGYLCTGTLVSDRVVLTAAHCFDHAPAFVEVVFGEHSALPWPARRAVTAFGMHPDFCGDVKRCKQDLFDYGYVVLAEPVADVAPARVLTDQAEWDEAMRIGAPVTVVGFGQTETGSQGRKLEVEVAISRFSATGVEFQAGDETHDSCGGDSGGPAFARLADGAWVLAGVTSRGPMDCDGGGIYGVPSAALCWLAEETGLDLRPDGCEACDCLDTTPARERCGCASDDAGGLAGALALLALVRRRRGARDRS